MHEFRTNAFDSVDSETTYPELELISVALDVPNGTDSEGVIIGSQEACLPY